MGRTRPQRNLDMGYGSRFFFSTDPEADTVYRRLIPSAEKREMQTERWNEFAAFLKDWFAKRKIAVTHWLQGSCKFGTQIRPLLKERSDVDLGIYAEWGDTAPPAKIVKDLLQEALNDYAAISPEVTSVLNPPKERACRIIFDGFFHIDVPIYHYNPKTGVIMLATETKGWELSDPGKMIDWFRHEAGDDDDRTQLRRMVRYLKGIGALKFKEASRPTSTVNTVLATRAFKSINGSLSDDNMLTEVCRRMVVSLADSHVVLNPVNRSENLNRMTAEQTQAYIEELSRVVAVGDSTRNLTDPFDICSRWAEVFGPLFPMPEDAISLRSASNLPSLIDPEVNVVATPQNGAGRLFTGRNRIGPIPKNCKIRFTIVSPLPSNAVAYWTVRNHGNEAADGNDLGHLAGTGLSISRDSAYNGNHNMDCTIKDFTGRPIGFRSIRVTVNDGVARNSRVIPGYRTIRR
jgi:hypothetical protein